MKKTTILIIAMTLGLGLSGAAKTALAETTIDGVNSADVLINGSIGKLDNTDEASNLPEGSDEWINVTVDTATAFHTTTASKHKNIESADYSIVNNSGRGVAVSLSGITGTVQYVDQLEINAKGTGLVMQPASVPLVTGNAFADLTNSAVWMKLANKEGKLNIEGDAAGAYGNAAKFYYSGFTGTNLPANVDKTPAEENYTLTLKFTSIQKDGTTIGVTP